MQWHAEHHMIHSCSIPPQPPWHLPPSSSAVVPDGKALHFQQVVVAFIAMVIQCYCWDVGEDWRGWGWGLVSCSNSCCGPIHPACEHTHHRSPILSPSMDSWPIPVDKDHVKCQRPPHLTYATRLPDSIHGQRSMIWVSLARMPPKTARSDQ